MPQTGGSLTTMTAALPPRNPPTNGGFGANAGAAAGTDKRTTALQSAVAILRGRSPAPSAAEVLTMAEAFHSFLTRSSGQ